MKTDNFSKNKSKQMRRIIFSNKIMIVLQCIFLIGTVASNYLFTHDVTFWIVFAHVVIFVMYNIIVENITTSFLSKKYSNIFEQISYTCREFYIQKLIYKTAKESNDKISSTLIIQLFVKYSIIILNIALLVVMVSFEQKTTPSRLKSTRSCLQINTYV